MFKQTFDEIFWKTTITEANGIRVCVLVAQSCPALCDSMDYQPARLLCPQNSPGKNTGVGYHFLLQRIFTTQGLNPGLLHCRQILYHLRQQESPKWRVADITLQNLSGNYKINLVYAIVMSRELFGGNLTTLPLPISVNSQMNISSNVLTLISPASSQISILDSCTETLFMQKSRATTVSA